MKKYILIWVIGGICLLTLLGWFLFFPGIPAGLQGRIWIMRSIQTDQGVMLLQNDNPQKFTLEFTPDGFRGHAACNFYDGKYHFVRFTHIFKTSWVFSTLMACLPQEEMQQDDVFFKVIEKANRYALDSNELRIYSENSMKVVIFQSGE